MKFTFCDVCVGIEGHDFLDQTDRRKGQHQRRPHKQRDAAAQFALGNKKQQKGISAGGQHENGIKNVTVKGNLTTKSSDRTESQEKDCQKSQMRISQPVKKPEKAKSTLSKEKKI